MAYPKKNTSYGKYTIAMITMYLAGFGSGYYTTDKTIIKDSDLQIDVRFSPQDNCIEKIVSEINNAQSQILVQTFSFTSQEIANALIQKHLEGVEVILIADKSQQKNNPLLKKMKKLGIKIYIDKMVGIAHNKIIIIDNDTVITGSFNFSHAAQHRNAENSLTIHSEKLAAIYSKNFWLRHSKSNNFLTNIP